MMSHRVWLLLILPALTAAAAVLGDLAYTGLGDDPPLALAVIVPVGLAALTTSGLCALLRGRKIAKA